MRAMIVNKKFDQRAAASRLWMDDACLRTLHQAGHAIGLYSHSHPTRMGALPAAVQRWEFEENHRHLLAVLGEAPVSMSHPCNSYGAETLPILRSLGIKIGFRANMEHLPDHSPYEYPREDHANLMREIGR